MNLDSSILITLALCVVSLTSCSRTPVDVEQIEALQAESWAEMIEESTRPEHRPYAPWEDRLGDVLAAAEQLNDEYSTWLDATHPSILDPMFGGDDALLEFNSAPIRWLRGNERLDRVYDAFVLACDGRRVTLARSGVAPGWIGLITLVRVAALARHLEGDHEAALPGVHALLQFGRSAVSSGGTHTGMVGFYALDASALLRAVRMHGKASWTEADARGWAAYIDECLAELVLDPRAMRYEFSNIVWEGIDGAGVRTPRAFDSDVARFVREFVDDRTRLLALLDTQLVEPMKTFRERERVEKYGRGVNPLIWAWETALLNYCWSHARARARSERVRAALRGSLRGEHEVRSDAEGNPIDVMYAGDRVEVAIPTGDTLEPEWTLELPSFAK